MFKTFLKDNNPGALEKALDCLAMFLQKVRQQIIVEHANEILSMLIEKCLAHAKPVIKEKAKTCINLIFTVTENFTDCGDVLTSLASHKNVKVSTS